MKLVSMIANKVIGGIFSKRNEILADIMMNWHKMVSTEFQNNSHPYKVTRSREKGKEINTLHIASKNSSISMKIIYQQGVIMDRINLRFGKQIIHKIKCVVTD